MSRRATADPYPLRWNGSLSTFVVADGAPLPILSFLTTFEITQLSYLKTAKEALREQDLNFEALIQRDIVPSHGRDIEKYLLNPTGDVRYFPPLLASIVARDAAGLAGEYQAPSIETPTDATEADPAKCIRWGHQFELRLALPLTGERTASLEIPLREGGQKLSFIPHLSVLGLSMDLIRLVVVDGQHRLRAFQEILEREDARERLAGLSIPVCIMWPPWAYPGSAAAGAQARPVLRALRRIFVDVNKTAKTVSGHFKILLDDRKLGAVAIRDFCEVLREDGLLYLVEWNQHEDSRSNLLTWYNKITGVGILAQCLMKPSAATLRGRRDGSLVGRMFKFLLNLPAVREELGEQRYAAISGFDADVTPEELPVLQRQIVHSVVPCLKAIFMDVAPYAEARALIDSEFERWRREGSSTYAAALDALRNMQEPESREASLALREIHNELRDKLRAREGFNIDLYRTQLFQQGLFAAFYGFVDVIVRAEVGGIDAKRSAEHFVYYLNTVVFHEGGRLFAPGSPWFEAMITQGTGAAIIKRKSTSIAVAQLLLAPLGNPSTAEACAQRVATPEEQPALVSELVELGSSTAGPYFALFRERAIQRFKENLELDVNLSDEEKDMLLQLRDCAEGRPTALEEDPDTAAERFSRHAGRKVDERIEPIRAQLERQLGYSLPGVPRMQEPAGDLYEEVDELAE